MRTRAVAGISVLQQDDAPLERRSSNQPLRVKYLIVPAAPKEDYGRGLSAVVSCQPDTCRLVWRPVLFDDSEQDRVPLRSDGTRRRLVASPASS
jgi:hypothetical protein